MAKKDAKPKKEGGLRRFLAAYKITREHDKWIGVVCLAWFLGVGVAVGALFWWFIHPLAGVIVGIPAGLLAALVVFGRRAERSAYAQIEGQPGAAAAALGVLRRGWQVQPAVAVTKNQDIIHRVVGRPGVILVGEGNPQRVRNLLAVEKKKHARVVREAPIHAIVVGDDDQGDDVVSVKRLSKHVMKLPKSIEPHEITDLLQRLKALDAMRPQLPVPKGPMPTSMKAARQGMRGR
ncbi:MAG: DUF4191 domain-containing protein [Propionibacteriales bacterium]|nr:DUF4191 domain-containing protein [Propionibacteriales bacterium]